MRGGAFLVFLSIFFVCRGYAAENKIPQELQRNIDQIRADFKSKRTTEALHKATELSERHKNEPQVHLSLGILLASEGQSKPAQLELEKALRSGTDFTAQR
jgi:Flp pilus assembly protein TadD